MIGSYAGISFTVSEDKVQTFQEMSRETASRWNTHEVIGAKPKQEFLGPDLDSMTFTMQLSAWRGVSPLQLAEKLRQFCSKGEYDNLIVGGRNFGKYLIESVSETYNVINNRGEVVGVSVMKITGENLTPDLRQQVELLCATPVGSVVLDRDFGLDMSFLDEPVSVAVNMAAAEISVKLEKYIPALRLIQVKADYDSAEQGIVDFEVIVEGVA